MEQTKKPTEEQEAATTGGLEGKQEGRVSGVQGPESHHAHTLES